MDKQADKIAKEKKAARVRELTITTLERLDQMGLPSTPEFYELWYRYFEGDPNIVHAINNVEGKVDEKVCLDLHTRLLSTAQQEGNIYRVNDQVQSSITSLVAKLKSATEATAEYGDSLGDVHDKVEKAKTIEDLGEVVTAVLTDTKKMVVRNRELETELIQSSKQVEDLKQYLDTVKKEATTDGLTGLTNRKAFDAALQRAVDEAVAMKKTFVLLMLDIDHFKKFNDTYGHPMGDQVLKLVGRVIVGNVKGQDTAARYGGEEFAVILPGTPMAGGLKVAESLRLSMEKKELVNKSDNTVLGSITLSVGAAEWRKGESGSTLIERADAALYQAKNTGRNRVCTAP